MIVTALAFILGAMAMWNAMRTRYAYPTISRWFYALDAALAAFFFFLATLSR